MSATTSITPVLVAEGQLWIRALDPELVWLAHEHEPWRGVRTARR